MGGNQTGGVQSGGGTPRDGANWLSNAGTAIGMNMMWATDYRLPFGAGSNKYLFTETLINNS